ncbi:MAG: hypothetical protein K5906_04375 [Bacilli bacterium]|nr:hypothetical protein [Bacilli bacterium]
MNKKLLFTPFLALPLLLAGCGTGGGSTNVPLTDDYFKEYTFTTPLTDEERKEFDNNLFINSHKAINNIIIKTKANIETEYQNKEDEVEKTITFYEDSAYQDAYNVQIKNVSKYESSAYGITNNQESTTTTDAWDTCQGVTVTSDNGDGSGDPALTITANEGGTRLQNAANHIFSLFPAGFSALDIFKNDDGTYSLIYSDIQKTINYEEWGYVTKEYVSATKYQSFFKVDSNYQFVSGYYYVASYSNKDPFSKSWNDEVKRFSYSYSEYSFNYGNKEKRSIATLNTNHKLTFEHNFSGSYQAVIGNKEKETATVYTDYNQYYYGDTTLNISKLSSGASKITTEITIPSNATDLKDYGIALILNDTVTVNEENYNSKYYIDFSSKITSYKDLIPYQFEDDNNYYVFNKNNTENYSFTIVFTYKAGNITINSVTANNN